MNSISVKSLTKQFPTPTGSLQILDGIDVVIQPENNLAVIGPSGSGKSTFLHIVGTLDHPSGGEISILGQDPSVLTEHQLAEFRNQSIGFVFQDHHLLPQLTARENVVIPAIAQGKANRSHQDRAAELLTSVGLKDRMDHRPNQLSGGERQRVAVARALMNEPKIILADEPTGSLDQVNAEAIGELLLELQKQHALTLVCVTHNDDLAKRFDQTFRLEQGKFGDVKSPPN